jgi:hypothetical protein
VPVELDAFYDSLVNLPAVTAAGGTLGWLQTNTDTPAQRYTRAALLYMTAAVPLNDAIAHVTLIPGIAKRDPSGQAESFLPPRLVFDVFDDLPADDPLTLYFWDRINQRFNNGRGELGGYQITPNGTFKMQSPTGEVYEGRLQFRTAYATGASSETFEQSAARAVTESASSQQSHLASLALWGANAGQFFTKMKKTEQWVSREGLADLGKSDDVMRMLFEAPIERKNLGAKMHSSRSPLERAVYERELRSMAAFDQPLKTKDWSAEEKARVKQLRTRLAGILRLPQDAEVFMDFWTRRMLARPKLKDPANEAETGHVTGDRAAAALEAMITNVLSGRFPTWGAAVPALSARELRVLYNANTRIDGWKPKGVRGQWATKETSKGFVRWFDIMIGEMRSSKSPQIFFETMDGYMHSFRGEDPLLEELPISIDDLRSLDLLDSETNEMVASRDPFYRQRLKDAPLFNADSNDIRALFNGQLESSGVNAPGTRSAQASTARNLFQWHKRGKIPFDISERSGDIEKHGRLFRREGTDTAGFLRTMIKLREAQGMFHPWLFATGPLEAFQRASVVEAGALLSGESTSALGRRFSQLQERINASSFAGTQLGRALGADVKPRFDADSIRFMQNAISAAGRLPEFRSFIHGEIFEHDTPLDASAAERGLTKIVNKVGSWQDPFRGAPQRNIGQLYLGAAARAILNGVDGDAVPLNTLLVDFTRDVEAIAKAAPRAHAMALRTLENTRGINETWGSLLFGGAIDSLARSENALINFSANVFGKIPYRFQKYAFSLAENITGAQFVGALVTLAMQGRSSGKKWGKLQAFLSGRRGQPDPNVDGTDVLLETLQSADFADMFIRSGLTHTALATVALAMGSLDGEDDEDERRRKAEEVQGSGHVYDPRDLTNDFRNADSIFLEDIPLLGAAFQVTTQGGEIASPVELHWVLKQFVSPALGISKFAKTGDLRQILWGFQDAIGSFPLVDTMRFDDAMKTADQLFQKATDTASNANEESIPEAFEFVLNGVMTLERMLFENSFINSIYVASDRYDRDPWRIVDLDATGEIQRDDLSAPMAADALSRYLGDGETTQTGYAEYDYAQGTIRGYAESRLGVAIAGSLFTGLTGGAPIFRQNQAIRERTINKEEIDPQLAEQLILSQWDPNNEREVLTRDGAEAVLRGLHAQTVKPGDPALDNIYISAEMRDEIERSLMAQTASTGSTTAAATAWPPRCTRWCGARAASSTRSRTRRASSTASSTRPT